MSRRRANSEPDPRRAWRLPPWLAAALMLTGLLLPWAGAVGAAPEACDAGEGETRISVHCGQTPSATFDASGRLWVTFVQDRNVYVSHSDDLGRSYSESLKVTPQPEDAEHNGENRPKIIVNQENIYLSWTTKTSANFTGDIRFARSTDGGNSFSEPRTINDDGELTGHRFESLFMAPSGHLYLAWIDKRDRDRAQEQDQSYPGAAVYYAVSEDRGASFSRNRRAAHNSCECCRIAMAPHGEQNAAIFWRQIFNGDTRDHAIAVLRPDGTVENRARATRDEWQINACPHHGPAMAAAGSSDEYHMSWFSNGSRHKGVYYGRHSLERGETTNVVQVDGQAGAGHPSLAVVQERVHLVWKRFNGSGTELRLQHSDDGGRSWSEPTTLMSTSENSDHPLLIDDGENLFLSWHTEESGYVFEELSHAQ